MGIEDSLLDLHMLMGDIEGVRRMLAEQVERQVTGLEASLRARLSKPGISNDEVRRINRDLLFLEQGETPPRFRDQE